MISIFNHGQYFTAVNYKCTVLFYSDIDECDVIPNVCDGADCLNGDGSYYCEADSSSEYSVYIFINHCFKDNYFIIHHLQIKTYQCSSFMLTCLLFTFMKA
jgi:hypothetical protein